MRLLFYSEQLLQNCYSTPKVRVITLLLYSKIKRFMRLAPGVKICTKNVSQVNQAEQHHSGVILKNYSYYVTFSIPDDCLARISMLTIMVHCLARISMLTSMVHEDGPLEQDDLKVKIFGIFHCLINSFPSNIFNFGLDFEL